MINGGRKKEKVNWTKLISKAKKQIGDRIKGDFTILSYFKLLDF